MLRRRRRTSMREPHKRHLKDKEDRGGDRACRYVTRW